jgi:hypothetical protein
MLTFGIFPGTFRACRCPGLRGDSPSAAACKAVSSSLTSVTMPVRPKAGQVDRLYFPVGRRLTDHCRAAPPMTMRRSPAAVAAASARARNAANVSDGARSHRISPAVANVRSSPLLTISRMMKISWTAGTGGFNRRSAAISRRSIPLLTGPDPFLDRFIRASSSTVSTTRKCAARRRSSRLVILESWSCSQGRGGAGRCLPSRRSSGRC